jgi:TolB-like protein
LRDLPAWVSPDLEKIIDRCLRKDPLLRFQTMTEIKSALENLAQRSMDSRVQQIPSVAVLPFSNVSGDEENEYFSDGLTEEIINALAQVRGLRGVSRSSAFQFKGTNEDAREVGRKLGVQTILEGSVRRAGNRLRITTQLVKVADGRPLWSERFERMMEDLFEVQDEVARAIVTALKPRLLTSIPAVSSKPHVNLEAHDLYLKGRYLWNQQTPEGVVKARSYFEQAVRISPQHAMAYVGLADCHLLLTWYGLTQPADAIPKARTAAVAALGIDDTLALAHCSLALVQAGYDWNWTQAAERFRRALELGPGFSTVHFHYALDYLTPMGQLDDAVDEIRRAEELDPLSLITRTALGGCLHRKGQYDAAIKQFQNTLEIDPDFYHARWSLARALERKYLFEDAVHQFQKADELCRGDNTLIRGELGHCYGLMSEKSRARAILDELEEKSRETYVTPLSKAFVLLGLEEMDAAFRELDQALAQHSRPLVWINVDPRFERLRSDERFSHLLQRIGLPQ